MVNLSDVKKTDINEYRLKGGIIFNVDVVWITGRHLLHSFSYILSYKCFLSPQKTSTF